ncbi:hypothetical protein D6D21_02443 [Aureobasidium pullulans]|uniref:Peptidase A1 domain-containing protein n=1 Tax=Aureobasidium pullulans TaxID=5580 RepID=A0A4V4IVF1_AURPU|nr:hypothetical protein D6D21_02443 [Aureobasidium pullulans]THW89097.1 hypothetical protein D6D15_05516 [Aureobasidium pullulans]
MISLFLFTLFCFGAYASVPRSLNFDTAVGPDGPWNALIQAVSWPERNVTLLPSLTKTNLFVHSDACSDPRSACPQSETSLWTGLAGTWSWMNSTLFDASTWDPSLKPLNLSGQASYISDRITLKGPGDGNPYLDFTANAVDQDINVNYPSADAWYTLNTGFFSLYGEDKHVDYVSVNGSDVSLNTTLPLAYSQDAIPSSFYGLHLGSASSKTPVPGSLVLGGYDKSRCLTTPIVSDTDTFVLTDINIGVADGASPFPADMRLPVRNLLDSGGSGKLKIYPNPGVPYLYLPSETCNTISEHLPVTFNKTLGLYLWNTSAPSFEDIMTSPSYLSFNFSTDSSTSTVYIPFALLNLTLEWPLVDFPTQFFPCSPYEPSDGRYHLGRAFLQGAFMAQDWKSGKLMLAQAPGPDLADVSLVTISSNDTSVSPMVKAPSWNVTWASKLKALERGTASTSLGGDAATGGASHLSSGSIAGIVVGIVGGLSLLAGLIWAWHRRQKAASVRTDDEKRYSRHWELDESNSGSSSLPSEVWAPGKHGLTMSPVEMDAADINELDGGSMQTDKWNEGRK